MTELVLKELSIFPDRPDRPDWQAQLRQIAHDLRLDATGISVWWRDHADHHMRVLMGPQGPFYNCDKSGHRDPAHLEPKKAPAGWFPDVRIES